MSAGDPLIASKWCKRVGAGVCVAASLLALGCGNPLRRMRTPVENIVAFTRQGFPVDPSGNVKCGSTSAPGDDTELYCQGRQRWWKSPLPYFELVDNTLDVTQFDRHVDNVLSHMEQSGKKHVLLFIHGGLNSRAAVLNRAKAVETLIRKQNHHDEDSDIYPIFVHWRSSLGSTYKDHVLSIRQGKYYGRKHPYRWLAPFYFLADIGHGIVRAPIIWFQQIKNSTINRKASRARHQETVENLKENYPSSNLWINEEQCDRAGWRRARRYASLAVTIPTTKLLLTPLVDGAGSSAWKVMLRRTETMFASDIYFRGGYLKEGETPQAPFARFLEKLGSKLTKDHRLSIVGHSMGAILANNIIRDYGDQLSVDKLVYMAAASELKDYQMTVIPYLQSQEEDKTQVYHLTLGVRSETEQLTAAGDLIARGSLLVWLDDFLAEPATTLERRAGYARNLLRVAMLPGQEDLDDRIHFKVYGDGVCHSETDPRKHGDFSSHFRFWDEKCWDPESRNDARCFGRTSWVGRIKNAEREKPSD